MKAKLTILLIAVLPLFFVGCEKSESPEDTLSTQTPRAELKIQAELCGETTPFVFKEYQGYEIGTGILGNDEENFYVAFQAPSGWTITGWTMYVGTIENLWAISGDNFELIETPDDIPNTAHFNQSSFTIPPPGNPGAVLIPPGTASWEYSFNLAELPEDCFVTVIAASFTDGSQTKGGYGYVTGLKSDGYYMDYCVQECDEPELECETVFAYNQEFSYCFSEFNKKTGAYNPTGPANKNFSRWGWTNELEEGDTYNFEIWAGAGQCDLSKGTLVGNLEVEYYGSTATVIYNMFDDYILEETHLYIGDEPIPTGSNGKATVAPGQYPYSDGDASSVEDKKVVYVINNLSGDDIWVVAHGVVCGEYDD